MEQRYRNREGFSCPEYQSEERKQERKVIMWLLAVLAATLVVGFLMGRATADESPVFPVYKVGTPTDVYASVCLDATTAKNIALLQQSEGIKAARDMFVKSGVCFADYLNFVPVAILATYPMLTPDGEPYFVSIMEVKSARNESAPHLYVITEGTLVDEPDT